MVEKARDQGNGWQKKKREVAVAYDLSEGRWNPCQGANIGVCISSEWHCVSVQTKPDVEVAIEKAPLECGRVSDLQDTERERKTIIMPDT